MLQHVLMILLSSGLLSDTWGFADDAEGTLERVLQQQWLSSGMSARSEFTRAGMQVLLQLWSYQQLGQHAQRLNARLAAVVLEEVGLCA